jgi:hypothetical protein
MMNKKTIALIMMGTLLLIAIVHAGTLAYNKIKQSPAETDNANAYIADRLATSDSIDAQEYSGTFGDLNEIGSSCTG